MTQFLFGLEKGKAINPEGVSERTPHLASVEFGRQTSRNGHVMVGLLASDWLVQALIIVMM